MPRRPLEVLLLAAGCALAVASIVACNAVLGIEDVQLKGANKITADASVPEPGPEDDPEPEEDASAAPRANVLQTALGDKHTCARRPDGTVRCWGDDLQGQTGGGAVDPAGFVTTPRDVTGITDAVDIAAGSQHTCVAHANGKVSCWGFNLDGQLGNGEAGNRSATPVEVVGISNAFAVAAGGTFSCALRGSGSVACWGGNGSGQLGRGDDSPSTTPVSVADLGGVVSIAAGSAHVCVAKNTGEVLCWGDGANGQLGKTGNSPRPIAVANINNATQVAATGRSSCALTNTGSVLCWGANDRGQLGNGASGASSPSPVPVATLSDAVAIAGGKNHVCAALQGGGVVCWGGGGRGQLGDGKERSDTDPQATIVTATGIQNAIGVGAGSDHTCAPTGSNEIYCWGANDRGQLATDEPAELTAPAAVPGYP